MTPRETLLRALESFLREEVQEQLSGATAYQNRVAANVLALLARDCRYGDRLAALERDFCAARGLAAGAGAAALARALRDGDVAADEALIEHLRRRSMLALAIDNPGYSGLAQARDAWPETARWLDTCLASAAEC